MRFLFLPLWSASLSLAAVCGPPAAAQREIDALPGFWNSSLPYEQKMAPRRALAAQYPEDYFAQVAAMRPPHEDSQWERNLAHYRAMKDRDAGELLEARLMFLGQGQNPRVTALIQAVVDRRPDLPAARLLMLQTAWRSQAYEQAEAQFREYRQLCPAGIAAFGFLRAVQDNAVWKPALDQAHRLLIGRTDPEAIEVWGEVLTAERVGSDNRTETDLAQLRELALYDRDDWANLLLMHMAYQGDSSGRDALRAELVKRRPDSRWAVEAAVAEWDRTHPHP
ncbi:MAG: hypothetical protein LAQ30_29965, partial [Acidobacteriia bacterium]|nr:hypothetical protein [Terriglobia bacterium]